ncbi:MAG TPA: hypothetical protein VKA87_05235 [Nitrososphaeraceae archaeon]|nr:hypothetical protein [Nitrososphaeraceae archaeon]
MTMSTNTTKKEIVEGMGGGRLHEVLSYFNTTPHSGSVDDPHPERSAALDSTCEHSDGCWYNSNSHDYSRV